MWGLLSLLPACGIPDLQAVFGAVFSIVFIFLRSLVTAQAQIIHRRRASFV